MSRASQHSHDLSGARPGVCTRPSVSARRQGSPPAAPPPHHESPATPEISGAHADHARCATWLDQVISGYGPVLAPNKVSEPHDDKLGSRLNWLPGVLGAIDGQRDTELAATAQANGSCTKSQRPPLVAILLPPPAWRVPVTVLAVLAALRLTAALSARLGDAHRARPAAPRSRRRPRTRCHLRHRTSLPKPPSPEARAVWSLRRTTALQRNAPGQWFPQPGRVRTSSPRAGHRRRRSCVQFAYLCGGYS